MTAHRLALASPRVRSVAIEAHEFPQLAARQGVRGVPKVVFSSGASFVGVKPEAHYLRAMFEGTVAPACETGRRHARPH